MRNKILFTITAILLTVGYLGQLIVWGFEEEGFLRTTYTLGYSLFYLTCWLFFLHFAIKRSCKNLFVLYKIFWFAGTIFSATLIVRTLIVITSSLPSTQISFALDDLFRFLFFVFVVPLIGFEVLFYGIVDGSVFNISIVIYAMMFLAGFWLAKYKRRGLTWKT